jgi:cytochrome P450
VSTLPEPVGLYDPFVHAMLDDPYPVYRQLRQQQPVYHNPDRGFWAVSRWSDVQQVARNWRTFSSAGGVDIDVSPQFFGVGDFIDSDPPKQDRLRAVVKDVFSPRGVRDLEAVIRAQVDVLLDPVLERGSCEFVSEVGSRLPLAIICGLLGFPHAEGTELVSLMHDVLARVPGSTEVSEGAIEALRALEEYIADAAQQRRRRPKDDVLSLIVASEKSGEVLPEEVTGLCLTLLLAGWETTSVLAANAMWLLARHPDQRQLLVDEPGRIPAAIEEMLRFESPAQQHSRVAVSDVELHGERIPAGGRVVMVWASANRDEERWPDGDVFDVCREPKRNLAFGEGIHHCVGAPLARLEARILLETLLAADPSWEVDEPSRFEAVVIRGISHLPVSWNG